MSVRQKIALTILTAGLLTTIGVVAAVLLAFQRFEYETSYQRADAFLTRVTRQHPELLDTHRRQPAAVADFLRSLVLYDPDVRLYLLDNEGRVLAGSDDAGHLQGYLVPMAPLRQATGLTPVTYVMGDDPAHPAQQAVVAAKPLKAQAIHASQSPDGFLYLVCQPMPFSGDRAATLGNTLARPGLVVIVLLVISMALLTAWVTATVTRPLALLTRTVTRVTQDGFRDSATPPVTAGLGKVSALGSVNEFGQLARGLEAMLATLSTQWERLQHLDQFRREAVSNLSHDLRSPLTATAACLETLQANWKGAETPPTDLELLAVALRNTRNAAQLVQSMGDLALLDEPGFQLRLQAMDLTELISDVAMRFAPRAAQQGILLTTRSPDDPVAVLVDSELIERALANLLDNALKFCGAQGEITLSVSAGEAWATLKIEDTGAGIALADQPYLFDRYYQARNSTAPSGSEGGKGLGLAIVKRIVELHEGQIEIASTLGVGTTVEIRLPARRTDFAG